MIEIKNLRYVHEDNDRQQVVALDGVNLTVAKGEFVAIVGANGCGKSTLARHINALLTPTEGQVTVDGLDTGVEANVWPIRQKVGMVFQNPDNQIVAAVVEEDVAFGPENVGVPSQEIRQRVDAALALVEMQDYAKHAPHLLSGGQKQRVAIAGILALQPECIVFDEPTAMLDPRGRREVVETVRRLNREQGITVVYITHYMQEALAADRVVVMHQGKIVMTGTPAEVFSRPKELEKLSLEAPFAACVAAELRQHGVKLPDGIVKDEDLVGALCR